MLQRPACRHRREIMLRLLPIKRIRVSGTSIGTVVTLIVLACSSRAVDPGDPLTRIDVGLPLRAQAPDVSRLTAAVRRDGGNVFVRLTGEPTPLALEVLSRAGLSAAHVPDPPNGIVTFDSLRIATVWGWASAQSIPRIAGLLFVTMIEPSGDLQGIGVGDVELSRRTSSANSRRERATAAIQHQQGGRSALHGGS